VIGFDEKRFDRVLQFLMESGSLRCPEELSGLHRCCRRSQKAGRVTHG
jgi:hypothetical protein